MFDPNVVKCAMKMNFTNFKSFVLLIINVKIIFSFEEEWCTFNKKKRHLKKKCRLLKFEYFKHAKRILICIKFLAFKLYE